MERERKNKIIRNVLIGIIAVAALIFIIFILEIFVLRGQRQNKKPENNVEENEAQNVQNVQENNTQQNTINQVNNEQTAVIIPNLNEVTNPSTTDDPENTQLISTTYYYNQLDESGKIIYTKLKENKGRLKEGNYKIDFGTQFNTLLHTQTGENELNISFQSAWNAFSYDEADLFYIDISKMVLLKESVSVGGIVTYNVSIGPKENSTYLRAGFETKEKVEAAQKQLQHIVEQVVEQTKNDSPAVKAKRIHNWIVSAVEYDASSTAQNRFHIYGALHEGKAVCEGYARSYKYLMEKVGVPCILISGTATNSDGATESHAWNYVQISNSWYGVDVTWDDPIVVGDGEITDEIKYRYFLKGYTTFTKDHKEDGKFSEGSKEFSFPVLTVNDYNG
ncbi:MAG: hypothetical protein HFJ28_00275 [Clostridia bacterium]|nr:hypothetical protein [Clostridia bacterium]